jgi:branched-subunit amino acid transport protein
LTFLTIALMAGAVFLLRIGGFLLAGTQLPAASERLLRFVPVAVLSALTVSLVTTQVADDGWTLVAIVAGAAAVRVTARLWVCIVAGVSCYWLLHLVSGYL